MMDLCTGTTSAPGATSIITFSQMNDLDSRAMGDYDVRIIPTKSRHRGNKSTQLLPKMHCIGPTASPTLLPLHE